MTAHRAYWHAGLQADFCESCGDNWPCLPYREANPPCACSHARSVHWHGEGGCWMSVCACGAFRPKETAK